jgi:lactoylglutathione lyase
LTGATHDHGFNHVSFTVSNLDMSVDYYVHRIGLELISLADRPAEYVERVTGIRSGMRIAYLRGHRVTLELIEYSGSAKHAAKSSSDSIGCGHICFNVDDIEGLMTVSKARGVCFIGDPVCIPAGTNKDGLVVYALDPDGIVTEFIQPPR